MYTYKTEILMVGTKLFSDKADANDIAVLDQLINERAADGWELVTYDYMAKTAVGVCWYILAGKDTPWRSRPRRAHGCRQAVPPLAPGRW